jgi:hypothetical protein
MVGGWTRRRFAREFGLGVAAAPLVLGGACGPAPTRETAAPPASAGPLRMTRGRADVRTPRDTPSGDTWVYGLALPLQIAPRLAALFCNIKGARGNDFEAGNDLVLFDAIDDGIRGTVALTRNSEGRNPKTGETALMVKYPARGGFVPLGAKKPDGSAHPHAGTGFGIHQALAWAPNGATEVRGSGHYQCFELQQFAYDGTAFRVVGTETVEMPDLLPGWTIHDGALSNGILDGDDFLVGMAGGKFDPKLLEENNGSGAASGAGLMRWRRDGGTWRPVSFVPITEPDHSFEPSLIRDLDGSLLFCARGGQRAIRVWRSTDGGSAWTKVLHVEGVASGSPITLNRAADGTPYIATNLYDVLLHPVAEKYRPKRNEAGVVRAAPRGRERLAIWPLSRDRTELETPILARDTVAEFGPAPSGDTWNVDHATSMNVQLRDGGWHNVIAMRICDHGEVSAGVQPAPQSGTYIEEVVSPGQPIAAWSF